MWLAAGFIRSLKPGERILQNEKIPVQHQTQTSALEPCVVRRFRRCANVIQCTYTNLDSTVFPNTHLRYTIHPIAPRLQTCTACYCAECCG
jgi:hypothetical protein